MLCGCSEQYDWVERNAFLYKKQTEEIIDKWGINIRNNHV